MKDEQINFLLGDLEKSLESIEKLLKLETSK